MHPTQQPPSDGGASPAKVVPEVRWARCPACRAFIYYKRLERNHRICPECNHHFRLPVRYRLAQLLDEDSFTEMSGDLEPIDALGFVDSKPYPMRLVEAQRRTGNPEGAIYGTGTIAGRPVVVAAMDFDFMGGSMGAAVGEAITRAAELAVSIRTPLLTISASGGARMQEGCLSLMQLAKTSQAVARLHEEGVLHISLLTDPTYGGTSASFATLGDVLISEPSSHIGFAGPHVIEQTIHQKLPERFQTAEFLLECGLLDLIASRENLRRLLSKLLSFHAHADQQRRIHVVTDATCQDPCITEGELPITDPAALPQPDAWEIVKLARHLNRPTTLDYIGSIFDDFLELRGDRLHGDDPALVGGLARLGRLTVMVIGHQKGHTTAERVGHNFGMANPEGYRKAVRLMQYAAKFGIPIVTLVDTPGAYPGVEAEARGQAHAIARSIMEMARLPVPIVTVITGEGASGGAMAVAVGDRVLMMENAWYGVISPEGCSVILFKSAAAAPRAAAALRVTARDLLSLGVVDAVVPEPPDGAHTDPVAAAANLKSAITLTLAELLPLPADTLLTERYARFRAFGAPGLREGLSRTAERGR